MAVVEFSIKDLESLVGRKLSKTELEIRIPMMGFPLEKMEKDSIFYEVFPNRPDMLSVEGFARSVRHFLGIDKTMSCYNTKPGKVSVRVDKSVKSVRPFVAAAVIRNVRLTSELVASLMQMQEKLHETLGRKRSKVAIGVHDFDRVKPPFTYTAADPEKIIFVPLDADARMNLREICRKHPKGTKYAHILEKHGKWPVILDSNNEVLSFPPIINGELTRVTDNTKSIFIDITGTSWQAVNDALNIITTALHERGCFIETVEILDTKKYLTPDMSPRGISVDAGYAEKMLGISLSREQFMSALFTMGFGFEKQVLVPAYRTDIMHPIDIVEDVAIAYGYEKFEPRIPEISTISQRNPRVEFMETLRDIMTGMGLQEVVGMILTNEQDEFARMNIKTEEVCETSNPLTVEFTICRKSLLPSLMRTLFQNKNREYPQKIFETGLAMEPDTRSETGAREMLKIACAFTDTSASYEDISPVADALMRSLGIDFTLRKSSDPRFIAGRCAEICIGKQKAGIMGETNPLVLENWKIEKPVAFFEIDAGLLMEYLKNRS